MINKKIICLSTFVALSLSTFILKYTSCNNHLKVFENVVLKKVKRTKAEKATAANERFEQYLNERGGEIDQTMVQKVRAEYQKQLRLIKKDKELKDGGIAGWDWLGPGNIGGRSRAIAIKPTNPNEIFFGSVAGGLWKSNNAGASWFPIDDFWASLAVSDIVFDGVDPNTMYVATGEYGSFNTTAVSLPSGLPGEGIFKSMDGGITWNSLSSTTGVKWFHRLATVPGQANVLYAIFANGGDSGISGAGRVAKSFDGGVTWPTVLNLPSIPQSIAINPNNVEQVMVGCIGSLFTNISGSFSPSSFVDITGSASNQIPSTSGRIEIAFGTNYVYALCNINNGEVWRSSNSGSTWIRLESDEDIITQGNYCMAIWVDPSNDNNVMVGGLDLWVSTDGGVDFDVVSDWTDYRDGGGSAHADQHYIIAEPNFNGTTNNLIYVANDGGIQRAQFGSSSWTNLANSTLGVTTLTSAAISTDGARYIGGAHDNSFSIGNESTSWYQPTTGDGGSTLISPNNKNILYAFTQFGSLHKSTDGGSSWCLKANFDEDKSNFLSFCLFENVENKDDRPLFYTPLEMDPFNGSITYVGARRFYRSTDGAENYSMMKDSLTVNGRISTIEISKSNTNVVWLGYTDGIISRTSNINSIANWVDDMDASNAIPNAFIMDIAVHPSNDNLVALAIGGYRTDQIWLSTNAGGTWTDVSNDLPGVHVNTITWHPTNQNYLYVGTDLGVYASDNQGTNWNVDPLYTGNSDGPVNTQISELFWQGLGTANSPFFLCAASSGRGLWRSSGPIDRDLYVDKLYTGEQFGTTTKPYQTFRKAVDVASDGKTIFFQSNGDHNEVPSPILIDKRVDIKLANGSVPVVIK